MSAQTRMVHTGPGHWSSQTTIVSDSQMARRAREEQLRRATGADRTADVSRGGSGGLFGVVMLVVLAFGSKSVIEHAHAHHQGVLAFLAHSLATWLT